MLLHLVFPTDLNVVNVSASSSITAGDGAYITGHIEVTPSNFGLSTFSGKVSPNGGVDLTAGQSLGIQTSGGDSTTHHPRWC